MAIVINTNEYLLMFGSTPRPDSEGRFTFTAQEEDWSFTGTGPYADLAKAARRAFSQYFKTNYGRIDLAI
jgi:hypothetical protein